MRGALVAIACLLGTSVLGRSTLHLLAQVPEERGESMPGFMIADPAGAFQGVSHVPPPPAPVIASVIAGLPTTFIITYDASFPEEAKPAFQAAADIWASQIHSSVPITVTASWEALSGTTLGQAGPARIFRDFTGAPLANTWYPVALANALHGSDLDPAQDITASFSSSYDCSVKPVPCWYYGTDGAGGGNYYDFMSVVMHELGHGLGFIGSMELEGMRARWGSGGAPYVYDRFAVNGSSQSLINTSLFGNPSPALLAQLTGNDLFFNGPTARTANGGANPRLYAPSVFVAGSTYNHLSQTSNSLMTPFRAAGEAVHDPGNVTRGIFIDMGWDVSLPPAPIITSIAPRSWSTAGGVPLTITGAGYLPGAGVTLDGIPAASVVVVNETTITAIAPPHISEGVASVVVTNADTQSGTLTNAFTYVVPGPTPAISGIAPSSGPTGGGTAVTISGNGFVSGAIVTLGGREATSVNVTATIITAAAPGHGPGLMSVVVTNPDGQSAMLSNAFTYPAPAPADSDGDRRSEITVWRPSTGVWYLLKSPDYHTYDAYQWGIPTDMVFGGDFDGDGKTDLTAWRPSSGTWYILKSSTGYTGWDAYQWGLSTDTPLVGDFDGDGLADVAVWRPSTGVWDILKSSTNYGKDDTYQWGLPSDVPLVGDFDSDGRADVTVWRPSNGTWYILKSSTGYKTSDAYQWGVPTDVPVVGDFDGDGKADVTVWRPSTGVWYIRYSSTGYSNANDSFGSYQWGGPEDIPMARDFDGDGRTDIAVYRPSTGVWYIRYSSQNYNRDSFGSFQWGAPGDVPVR